MKELKLDNSPKVNQESSSVKWFLPIFMLISLTELIYHLIPGIPELVHFIAKPLIMLSLLVYFLSNSRTWNARARILCIAAILCSLGGDIFLMFQGPKFFLMGLGSFLLAQVCYIFLFAKGGYWEERNTWTPKIEIKTLAIQAYGIFLLVLLWPNLGDMWIPVSVYAVVIMLMGMAALSRKGWVDEKSFQKVFWGALLFILSDSLIAINKFLEDDWQVPKAGFWIMLTYILAQYLIVTGLLANKKVTVSNPDA